MFLGDTRRDLKDALEKKKMLTGKVDNKIWRHRFKIALVRRAIMIKKCGEISKFHDMPTCET